MGEGRDKDVDVAAETLDYPVPPLRVVSAQANVEMQTMKIGLDWPEAT
jgi:hypothetical protein